MPIRRSLAALVILLAALTATAQKRRAVGGATPAWQRPACSKIGGLLSIRFVAADGTVVKSTERSVNASASDIAAAPQANVLYAAYGRSIYVSRNAGCTWRLQADVREFHDTPVELVTTHAPRVYAYTQEHLARIEGGDVETIRFPERVLRLAANRANARHLRAVALSGSFLESTDGGDTWTALSDITPYGIYSAAFDPLNLDHILAATTAHGQMMASRDGGRTWTRTALPQMNVWAVEFSPADPRIVWAQGLVVPVTDYLYRSRDSGDTWERVLTSGELGLSFSRSILAPHVTEPETLAMTTHQGVMVYRGHTTVVSPDRPWWGLTWSPAGTLYFAAPDEVIIF